MPALQFDDGQVLTENIAILSFIADKHSALMPKGETGRYRLLESLAYISTEVHKAFKPLFSPDASDAEKTKARETISRKLDFIANRLKTPYLLGNEASVVVWRARRVPQS